MTSTYIEAVRHPLATKEGWASFTAQAATSTPPRLLPAADFERLDGFEREVYNDAR
ncbi:hypothetical protein ACWDKQ_26845 [Saccharopolyspora sp. NPDC000995]